MGLSRIALAAWLSIFVAATTTNTMANGVGRGTTTGPAQATGSPAEKPDQPVGEASADAAVLDELRKVKADLERARQLESTVLRQKREEEAKARMTAAALKKLETKPRVEAARDKPARAAPQVRDAVDQERPHRDEPRERNTQCRYKPVMTDDEIERCRQVREWTAPLSL